MKAPPPSEEGPTVAAVAPQECNQNASPNCPRLGSPLQREAEAFERLQTRAKRQGLLVHHLRAPNASPAFLVARTVASREFKDLAAVRSFLGDYEGRRYG